MFRCRIKKCIYLYWYIWNIVFFCLRSYMFGAASVSTHQFTSRWCPSLILSSLDSIYILYIINIIVKSACINIFLTRTSNVKQTCTGWEQWSLRLLISYLLTWKETKRKQQIIKNQHCQIIVKQHLSHEVLAKWLTMSCPAECTRRE